MSHQNALKGISEKYHVSMSKVEVLKLLFDDIGVQKANGHTWENMKESLVNILNNKISSRIAGSRVIRMVLRKTPFLDRNDQISQEGDRILQEMAEELYLTASES